MRGTSQLYASQQGAWRGTIADATNRFATGTGMEVLGPPLAISDSAS